MRFNGTEIKTGFKLSAFALAVLAVSASCATGAKTTGSSTPSVPPPPPSKIDDSDLGIDLSLKTATLSNGLQVVMVEDPTVPIVSYQTWYRVGSVDEHPGITGISHLFEHLMFKGTPKYGPTDFFNALEAKGAEVNAFTTRDYTVYYENFIPTLLEKVIDMESDRMANLTLTEPVMNGEKLVVLEERRMRSENTPEGKMDEALWALAYNTHPYRWPVIGYPPDLATIDLDQLQSYYKDHYQPKNAVVVIVGAFKAKQALEWIKKYYEPVVSTDRPKRDIPKEPEQNEEHRFVMYDDVTSERFAQAYHAPSATDDDSYALDVLANILFAGTSSRAYHLLVEQKDIALNISGSNYTPTYPGLFTVDGTMKPGVPASQAESALEGMIREVQEKGVTDEEIRAAVRQLTVQLVDGVRTPYGLGMLIGTVDTILGDPNLFASDLGKYVKVKASDVRRVAQKYLVPNNRSVVTLLPKAPEVPKKKKLTKGKKP